MDGLKMTRLFLALALSMTVASQPLETIATSGGVTLSTQLLNWAQVGFEAFLEWAKKGFGDSTDEEKKPSSEPLFFNIWNSYVAYIFKHLISFFYSIPHLSRDWSRNFGRLHKEN